jgi:hypothetical protein
MSVSSVFNDSVSRSEDIASNVRMNNELERVCNQAAVAQFNLLSRNLLGETEQNDGG